LTISTMMADRKGGIAFLVGFEGIEFAFSTETSGTWSGLTQGWTILRGMLRRHDLVVEQSVNLASAELSARGMTFRLVDGNDSDGNPYAVSDLMTGLQAANLTRLTATLSTGVGPALVQSTAAFASSGDIYCELETIGYTSKGGAQFDANLTRGKYGSKEVVHTYDAADANDVRADFGLVPEVTDRPASWYGRRCWFYAAEILPDGTLGGARLIWKGRVTGEVTCDGAEWIVPAESIWDALATEILAGQPRTVVKGILLENDVDIDVVMYDIDGGARVIPAASPLTVAAGRYSSVDDLYAQITDQLNAAIAAEAGPPDERYEIAVVDGQMAARQTSPAGSPTYETNLYLPDDGVTDTVVLAAALNMTRGQFRDAEVFGVLVDGFTMALPQFAHDDGHFRSYGPAPEAVFVKSTSSSTVPVERADDFSAWRDEQDGYLSMSVVSLDRQPFILESVGIADTLTLYTFTDFVQNVTSEVIVQRVGEPQIEVRLGVWIRGTMPVLWRDAFLDNSSVPLSLKSGVDSVDIDWVDLTTRFPGGVMSERDRVITEPTSFRDLLLEDLRWAGLVPIIEDGKVTARQIANGGLVREGGESLQAVDNDTLRAGDAATLSFATSRVVNRLTMTAKREQGRPGIPNSPAMEVTVQLNERQSQGRYRLINGVDVECSGVAGVSEDDISAHAYGVASSLFALTARPYPVCQVGCTGALWDLLPLDTCLLTHWLLPSPTTANTRGVTGMLAIVTGVAVDWTAYTVDLTLTLLTDGAQRSGFAPVARIIGYADMGGGTEPSRYRLEVEPDYYSDFGEDTFFAVGMCVELREWDDDSAPASESRVISAVDPANDYLYISAAPSAGMQAVISGGTCNMTLDQYDTANQTAQAKLYLHVADDADDLLGTSGVYGFQMG